MRNLATPLLHVYPAPPPSRTQSSLLLPLQPRRLHHHRRGSSPGRLSLDPSSSLSLIESADESLFHVSIDVSNSPDLAASCTRPGQYLQLRVPDVEKLSFLAIASPPSFAVSCGAFEFLVKSIDGSTAEILCGLKKGETVELNAVMGSGFDMGWIDHHVEYPTVLIFATGSGIS